MILRGIDGCPEGWFAASLDLATGRVTGEVFNDASSLLRDPRTLVTAIDIPIGLPSRGQPRSVDGECGACLVHAGAASFPHRLALCLDR